METFEIVRTTNSAHPWRARNCVPVVLKKQRNVWRIADTVPHDVYLQLFYGHQRLGTERRLLCLVIHNTTIDAIDEVKPLQDQRAA